MHEKGSKLIGFTTLTAEGERRRQGQDAEYARLAAQARLSYAQNIFKVVLLKSTPLQIRQLILYYY